MAQLKPLVKAQTKALSVSIDEAVAHKLDEFCRFLNRSKGTVVECLLSDGIDSHKDFARWLAVGVAPVNGHGKSPDKPQKADI